MRRQHCTAFHGSSRLTTQHTSVHHSQQLSRGTAFYPNVTLRSGIHVCYRKSVCRLLSVVCNVRIYPTQEVEAFDNISSPLCTLATL